MYARIAGAPAVSIDRTIKGEIARLCDLEVGALEDQGKLVAYGLDSVLLLDLMIGLEEAYDIEIDELDPRLAHVKTVGQLVAYVQTRLVEG